MTTTSKSKTGLIIMISLAVLIVAVLIYVFRDKIFGVKCDPNRNGFDKKGNPNPKCKFEDPNVTHDPGPPDSHWISDSSFPIKRWSWGPKVGVLQEKLGIKSDGKFGPDTEKALKAKTGKTSIATQAEYDAIVNPKPKEGIGGSNYDEVKTALGTSGKPTVTGGGVYIGVKGEKYPYTANFFTNNRMSINNLTTKKIYKGSYSNGGREIIIDSADGGYKTGTFISNSSVIESINDIINQIEA